MSLIDFLIIRRRLGITMTYDRFIKLFVTHHSIQVSTMEGKKRMFYVAIFITFSVFLESLCKFALQVSFTLNIFRPSQENQFDICALLFIGYARFVPLD